MSKLIIIDIPWNPAKLPYIGSEDDEIHRSLTEEWNNTRFEIWKLYTYASLCNQTEQDFQIWLTCNKETEDIVRGLFGTIKDNRIKLKWTDEKPDEATTPVRDFYYLFRLDSDDMIHRCVIEEGASQSVSHQMNLLDTSFVQFMEGYLLNLHNHEITYHPEYSPPYYITRYTYRQFFGYDELIHPMGHGRVRDDCNPVQIHWKSHMTGSHVGQFRDKDGTFVYRRYEGEHPFRGDDMLSRDYGIDTSKTYRPDLYDNLKV
jgi:hypothetical protein